MLFYTQFDLIIDVISTIFPGSIFTTRNLLRAWMITIIYLYLITLWKCVQVTSIHKNGTTLSVSTAVPVCDPLQSGFEDFGNADYDINWIFFGPIYLSQKILNFSPTGISQFEFLPGKIISTDGDDAGLRFEPHSC